MDLVTIYNERQKEKRRKNINLEEGQRLKMWRTKFEFTLNHIADFLSVEVKTIQKVEDGYIEGEYALVREVYELFLRYNDKELELEAMNENLDSLERNLQSTSLAVTQK